MLSTFRRLLLVGDRFKYLQPVRVSQDETFCKQSVEALMSRLPRTPDVRLMDLPCLRAKISA
jgi:hypothetical protein